MGYAAAVTVGRWATLRFVRAALQIALERSRGRVGGVDAGAVGGGVRLTTRGLGSDAKYIKCAVLVEVERRRSGV